MGVSITYTSDQSGATVDPQDVVRVHGKVYSKAEYDALDADTLRTILEPEVRGAIDDPSQIADDPAKA